MKTIDTNRDITNLLPTLVKKVVENKTYGKIEFKLKDMELYLSEKQKNGSILGKDLHEEMKEKAPVNLAYLQFFVDNPELFPKEWKGKFVYGWGTIVRSEVGHLYVPFLYEYDGGVVLGWRWLAYDWDAIDPALRFASISSQNSDVGSLEPSDLDLAIEKVKSAGFVIYKQV